MRAVPEEEWDRVLDAADDSQKTLPNERIGILYGGSRNQGTAAHSNHRPFSGQENVGSFDNAVQRRYCGVFILLRMCTSTCFGGVLEPTIQLQLRGMAITSSSNYLDD